VAAFRATLEEVAEAELVLRIVDAGDPAWEGQLGSVEAVLAEVQQLYGQGRAVPASWLVFNKVDQLKPARLKALKAARPGAHFVSALEGQGLAALKLALRKHRELGLPSAAYLLPHDALGRLDRHLGRLRVTSRRWTAQGLRLEAVLSEKIDALEPYRLRGAAGGPQ
jgi:GTPase